MTNQAATTAPLIFVKMAAIGSDLGAIGKDQQNKAQNFKFRGIDDVYNALQPLLAKHGVFSIPDVLEHWREERHSKNGAAMIFTVCKVKYTFYAQDGSHVCAIVFGEAHDFGDKSFTKAMSIAHKYAMLQTFTIRTEDKEEGQKDPDSESVKIGGHKPKPQQQKPQAQQQRPKQGVQENQPRTDEKGNRLITGKQRGRLFELLRDAGRNPQELKDMLIEDYGIQSTNDIPMSKYEEICKAIQS